MRWKTPWPGAAGGGGRHQSAAERPAGTQAGRHPRSRIRGVLRHVRHGAAGPGRQSLRGQTAAFLSAPAAVLLGPPDRVLQAGKPAFRSTSAAPRRLCPAGELLHRPRGPIASLVDRVLAAASVDGAARDLRETTCTTGFWSRTMRFSIAATRSFRCSACRPPSASRSKRSMKAAFSSSSTTASRPCSPACRWPTITSGGSTCRADTRADCCPEYLKAGKLPEAQGRTGRRVEVHTDSVQGLPGKEPAADFARSCSWITWTGSPASIACLEEEWQWIVRRARPRARADLGAARACEPTSSTRRGSSWMGRRDAWASCSPTTATWPRAACRSAASIPTAVSTSPTWPLEDVAAQCHWLLISACSTTCC